MRPPASPADAAPPQAVRDPLGNRPALRAARARSMSERLELALSWNAVAAELRAGLDRAGEPTGAPSGRR